MHKKGGSIKSQTRRRKKRDSPTEPAPTREEELNCCYLPVENGSERSTQANPYRILGDNNENSRARDRRERKPQGSFFLLINSQRGNRNQLVTGQKGLKREKLGIRGARPGRFSYTKEKGSSVGT